ncbi:MAG: 16S rRNA (cytosine(1402)-N(4))-methyltransferase RsmH [Planctomycetes bacterium]|nr:16S rRNA (cytosine(1402)-N(4))-methyltransferase RsmH [Planctomycetota bacterium]
MHQPVLLNEVVRYLRPQKGDIVVDATIGFGGHSRELMTQIQPGGRLIGIDLDREAISHTQEWLKSYLADGKEIQAVDLFCDNFVNLGLILKRLNIRSVDIILLDLGVSSYQLDTPLRGFSFHFNGPLDMRMNSDMALTAADVVNKYPAERLERIFRDYGQERWARRIARNIARARVKQKFTETQQLAQIIEESVPGRGKIHPATRAFQALRIEVNKELDNLGMFLAEAANYLKPGGRLGIISFHSLEDRLVKESFRNGAREGVFRILTKKPVQAGAAEKSSNRRSRSARLRVVERG